MIWIVPLLLIVCGLMLAGHGSDLNNIWRFIEFAAGVLLVIAGVGMLFGLMLLVM